MAKIREQDDGFLADLVGGEAKQITPNGTSCVSGGKLMKAGDGSPYTYHNDLTMRQGPGFGRKDGEGGQGGRGFNAANLEGKRIGNRSGA
jgi:hypothetical protein